MLWKLGAAIALVATCPALAEELDQSAVADALAQLDSMTPRPWCNAERLNPSGSTRGTRRRARRSLRWTLIRMRNSHPPQRPGRSPEVPLADRPFETVLDQIVRQIGIMRQRARKAAQSRNISFNLVQRRRHAPRTREPTASSTQAAVSSGDSSPASVGTEAAAPISCLAPSIM